MKKTIQILTKISNWFIYFCVMWSVTSLIMSFQEQYAFNWASLWFLCSSFVLYGVLTLIECMVYSFDQELYKDEMNKRHG